jgi:hypothetical protein
LNASDPGAIALSVVLALAAVAQGASAILIAVLTYRLARATVQYARAADLQIDELRRAREMSVRPHLHIDGVKVSKTDQCRGGPPEPYNATILLLNLGAGPAVVTYTELLLPDADPPPRRIGPVVGAGARSEIGLWCFAMPSRELVLGDDPRRTEFRLWLRVRYRDTLGKWQETRVPLRPELTLTQQGTVQSYNWVRSQAEEVVVECAPPDNPYLRNWGGPDNADQ